MELMLGRRRGHVQIHRYIIPTSPALDPLQRHIGLAAMLRPSLRLSFC
jgi:hypothetical protein